MMFTLLISVLLGQIADNINAISRDVETDTLRIELLSAVSQKGRANESDTFELYLRVPVSEEEMACLGRLQREDGSFSDIDYADTRRSAWSPKEHAMRIERLAIRYANTGDPAALEMVRNALRYWGTAGPVCRNWWYNEIGVPRRIGPAALLLKDVLDKEEMDIAIEVLDKASISRTGQNRVWEAGSVLIRGILQEDEGLVRRAAAEIASELKFSDGVEGLQKDWSFHQHGPQLQFGNYGLSFAATQCWWARAFAGTDLCYSPEKMNILRGYLENGLCQLVWNGYFDPNACGRQVFLNAQQSKALVTERAAEFLGIESTGKPFARFYPDSDFGIYRTSRWYASIRMQSSRICGFETTNDENRQGWFSSDGALLVRVGGDEYKDISPLWNWRHIPGATTWDDGTKPFSNASSTTFKNGAYNKADKVGGWVDGDYMVAYMDYCRDGLKARKAWFFFPEGIVCLGAGITKEGPGNVVTTIEQNLLQENDEVSGTGAGNGSVSYVSLCGDRFRKAPSERVGDWHDIAVFYPEGSSACGSVFDVFIDHGNNPSGDSYAYFVAPESSLRPARRLSRKIRILENTESRQSVMIDGKLLTVTW